MAQKGRSYAPEGPEATESAGSAGRQSAVSRSDPPHRRGRHPALPGMHLEERPTAPPGGCSRERLCVILLFLNIFMLYRIS